jgi:hypothetical protein
MKPGTHEHTACPLISRHWLLGPHGDGLQGSATTGATQKGREVTQTERKADSTARHYVNSKLSGKAKANWQKADRCRTRTALQLHENTNANALRTRYGSALDEWVARCALCAAAYRDVVHDVARGRLAARARAWVGALVSDARPISRTVRTEDTFRATPGIRVSLVFRQASASPILTLSVRAARRRVAWVGLYRFGS